MFAQRCGSEADKEIGFMGQAETGNDVSLHDAIDVSLHDVIHA